MNLFAYADNNFVNRIDYNGNLAIPIPNLVLIATGLLITTVIIFNYDAISKTIGCIIVGGLTALGGAISNAADSFSSAAQSIWKSIVDSFSRAKRKPKYKSTRENHHIVAQKATRAKPAREIIEDTLEDGVNSPYNMVSLKTGLHRRLHTNQYYNLVNSMIVKSYKSAKGDKTKQHNNVVSALGIISRYLLYIDSSAPF